MSPERAIHLRPAIGIAAHVLQGRELRILRVRVEQPALILIDRGIKAVRTERGATVRALPGQAIILGAGQTVDFTNSTPDSDDYEARWLVFDHALFSDDHYQQQAAQIKVRPACLLRSVRPGLQEAFQRATQALAPDGAIPDAVARQRMLEVLHWLLAQGVALASAEWASGVTDKVRAMIGTQLHADWTAQRVAGELAMAQATLRRKLAAEGSSLSELLIETRMAAALTLLQATTYPVSHIALSVGYASPSRFAVRFRQRFGFVPTAVRGHERTN